MRLVSIQNRVAEQVQYLNPAYFAMVMSTGAVAIAAELLGMPLLARGLTWLNSIAFIIISAMTVARVSLYPQLFWRDLTNHSLGLGFLTIVAGAGILGAQYVVIIQHEGLARALLLGAFLLWIVFTYTTFVAFTVKKNKPPLSEGINGGWLLAVVGTQAIANLGALLLPTFGNYANEVLFLCLCLWLCGGMIYIWIISLIFYRYTFYEFSASDLMPPYWINMGAMAISTLAGSMLIKSANHGGFLLEFIPFLKGFTVFFWATATWWIPMLVILGFWRHVYKGFALSYNPLYWGAVFPLGMYTVATCRLSEVMNLPFLLAIPRYFFFIALAAWLMAFLGLVRSMTRLFFHPNESRSLTNN